MPDQYYLAKQADFTAVADAIRTKGGTSAALEWPSEFVSAVNDIFVLQSVALGLSYAFYVVSSTYIKPILPSKVIISAPFCRNITFIFCQYIASSAYNLGVEEVEFRLQYPVEAANAFNRNTSVKKVTFVGGVALNANTNNFLADSVVEEVVGEIDLSQANATTSWAFRAPNLREIRIKKSTMRQSFEFRTDVISDASLVSIANGLDETATGKTLTLTSGKKAHCSDILGTVADGIFTQSDSGNVTLADFITNTKGWTLA